jgi:hypothetical protein
MAAASVEDSFFLEATEPPEARGLSRDAVRLLVSDVQRDTIEHARFRDLPQFLAPGDLLVVNTSGTRNAALLASTETGELFELHLSTQLPGGFWTVELRVRGPVASLPYRSVHAGLTLHLPAGGRATLLAPYPARSVSVKQEHAPSKPASPAKNSHKSKITARVARLLGARSPLLGRAPRERHRAERM